MDAMIDRHRAIVVVLVLVMIAVIVYRLYIWTWTTRDMNVEVLVIFGRSIQKRRLARSLLVSLFLQLVEGVVFLARNVLHPAGASLQNHFIFIRKLPTFASQEESFPGPMRLCTRIGFGLGLVSVSVTGGMLFASYAFTVDNPPRWLFLINALSCGCLGVAVVLTFYRNVSKKVIRTLLGQPNIWVLLLLTGLYLPCILVEAPAATIPFAVSLVVGVLGFIATDALLATNKRAIAWFGLVGMSAMIGSFVDYTVSGRGEDVVLINHFAMRVTKFDALTTLFVNFIFFFAEGVVAAVRFRNKDRRCVFVRALVPRGTVLFTQIHTPDSMARVPSVERGLCLG